MIIHWLMILFTEPFWSETQNQLPFFTEFAKTAGFDPLVAANWYPHLSSLLANRVSYHFNLCFLKNIQTAPSIARYYNFNIVRALLINFPDIKLDPSKFSYPPSISALFLRKRFTLTQIFGKLRPTEGGFLRCMLTRTDSIL